MSYVYAQERPKVFTEDGQIMFLAIRDRARKLIEEAGCARLDKIIHGITGDVWTMIACVDRLVEIGELKEVALWKTVPTAYRIYVFA